MMKKLSVSAPGKLLIAGEYAVLEGSKALVAAVNRRVIIRCASNAAGHLEDPMQAAPGTPMPEIARVFELEGEALPALDVDNSALYRGGRKLGLGSSAAQAVAAAGFLFAKRGAPLEAAQLFKLAHAAHQRVAPRGSGVDVLASAHGGLLLADPSRLHEPSRLDPGRVFGGLSMSVIDTGMSARTSTFLDAIEAHRASSPAASRRAFKALHSAMNSVEGAIARQSDGDLLEALDEYNQAMRALGELTSLPIVEERLSAIGALARECGGVSKPSGAGGGDIAVAFFPDAERRQAFERRASEAYFEPIALELDLEGARLESIH